MPFTFPSSPTVGQTSTQNGRSYTWSGYAWELTPASGGGGSDSRWDLFLPPAPTSLTATGGNAQVSLSWTAPTVLSQTPITDYLVQSSTNSGSTWTTFSDGTSTATSATVTGLTNGTAYVFRVAAVNGVGTGAYTAATASVTPGDVFRAIPTMTSNTAPSGVVSGVTNDGTDPANLWRAFDGDAGTFATFQRAGFNNPLRSLSYAFPDGQKSRISGYSIQPGLTGTLNENNYAAPNQWKVYGSDDGSTWTLLDTRTDINPSGSQWPNTTARSYTLASPANYRMYRWDWAYADANAGDNERIASVQLLE